VRISHFVGLERGTLDYIEAEFGETLLGLYSLLNHVPWINNPFSTRIAHRKMLQLRTASKIGFATPKTVVTNNPEIALSFAEKLPGDIAIKSLGAICVTESSGEGEQIQFGLFTRRVSLVELRSLKDTIRHQPTVFQEFLEKSYELRITCVGSRCFSCRIESRSDDLTADDYRFDTTGLVHTPQACPELEQRLQAYMRTFGLNFGCFDILVTKSGEFVFLECNPNGQWLWVENLTGLPIGQAIAQELISAHDSVGGLGQLEVETPPALAGKIAFRGGNAIHKLLLMKSGLEAWRYRLSCVDDNQPDCGRLSPTFLALVFVNPNRSDQIHAAREVKVNLPICLSQI
jgi:glutathione synthase/RimK-type ligase-like ATP-grasp enzyme